MARPARTEPRSFLGHPLTPQPVPLDPHARAAAARRIAANDAVVANPDILAHLVEMNAHLARVAHHAGHPAHRRVLWSGLARLDNTGVWSNRAGNGLASGAIWVFSPNVPIIVAAGTRSAFAPNEGPGVFLVPAGVELTLNAHTPQWTIYGNGTAGGLTATGAVPAVAANAAVYVVGAELTLESIAVQLTTSAVVANRQLLVTITDPVGNVVALTGTASAVAASAAQRFVWAVGYQAATVFGAVTLGPLPPLTLQAGSTVTVTSTNGLQAGDQFSAVTVSGSGESLGPASSSAGAVVDVTVYSDSQLIR